ncbi:hypothetical protein PRZ48_013455 [Zasmidium cellare]|uniref:Cupin type-2 domain-containing protein n=1 Tax=Zasmidium cellare TaxID=395010 RepID=A0ABR0E1K7_ZASCE|nr:hypothetical protein PRZ48_013455 [Zasmidium cellare]
MATPTSVHLPSALNQAAPKSTPSEKPVFTGSVAIDMLHQHSPPSTEPADSSAAIAMVTFTPSARTNWHWHERGQTLTVVKGQGWICDKSGKAKRIQAGDVLFCPAGTTHWHGADEGSEMMHLAVGLGETKWLEKVSDEEYAVKE